MRVRLVAQSCLTLCNPMDCSPPGSSVHGDSPGKNIGVGCHALLQGIFPTQVSSIAGGFFTIYRSESETERNREVPAFPGDEALFHCAKPSGVLRGPANSTASLICQKHTGKFPKVTSKLLLHKVPMKRPTQEDSHRFCLPLFLAPLCFGL